MVGGNVTDDDGIVQINKHFWLVDKVEMSIDSYFVCEQVNSKYYR